MSIEKLETEVAKAQKTVDEWEGKASAARGEAEELDRTSGAQILENPNAAEKITLKIQTLERPARAYDSAAVEARDKLNAVYRRHVEAEGRQLVKDAVAMRRDAEKLDAEAEKLIDKLEALQGVRYTPVFGHSPHVDKAGTYQRDDDAPRETKSQDLEGRAAGAESQAELVRYVLKAGTVSGFPGTPMIGHLATPPITQAALNAGAL